MTLQIDAITRAGAPDIYRRRHVKADGREVFLFAYSRPNQPAVSDELLSEPAMSQLRWHPFRQEWSIYAAGRQNRTYKPATAADPLAPSQPGGEPTEIPFSDFDIAVFENRFPSLIQTPAADLPAGLVGERRAPANGRCEVVVYTPEATGSLASLSDARRQLLVRAWIDRYEALFALGCEFVLPFENRGDEVGVTLHHPHGQIYGFPFTPAIQQGTVRAFEEGYDLAGAIKDWRSTYEIAAAGGISAFAPPFARFPFEIWLAPQVRRRGPWEFSAEEVEGFASLLGEVTRRLDAHFARACPYMLSLHAAPVTAGDSFHFTAQFYPLLRARDKVKHMACVEQASGVFTVDVLPEQAAAELRKA